MNTNLSSLNVIATILKEAILSQKVIKNHLIKEPFLSSGSTYLYPMEMYSRDCEVFVDSGKRNYFKIALQKICSKNKHLFKDAYFCNMFGETHSFIRFVYSDTLKDKLEGINH